MIKYEVHVDKDKTEWFLNGKKHRENGPAIEWSNGDKVWYKEGKRHRENGPAVEYSDGSKWWYKEGKRHREDGPAVEYNDGSKDYYYYGERLDCNSTEEFLKLIKLKVFW